VRTRAAAAGADRTRGERLRAILHTARALHRSGAMSRVRTALALALAALLGAAGCAGARAPSPEIPAAAVPPEARSLTRIAAEMQMHLRDDTYRHQRARRADGQNVFAVALWELDDLQRARNRPVERYENVDWVIEYARARALERQRRYAEAYTAFARVAAGGSILAESAEESAEVLGRFARHAGNPEAGVAEPDLRAIERRIAKWRELAWEYRGSSFEPLAREEAETWESLRVEWHARHGSPQEAIAAARRLVESERESKLHARHLIRLGDLCAEAARQEFLRYRAGLSRFDGARYERWLDEALSAYQLAGEARRSDQRVEAENKIAALLAQHEGVRAVAP
jgi:hypothetical protein